MCENFVSLMNSREIDILGKFLSGIEKVVKHFVGDSLIVYWVLVGLSPPAIVVTPIAHGILDICHEVRNVRFFFFSYIYDAKGIYLYTCSSFS